MTQPWVAIQRNPRSGSGRRRRHLVELVHALRKRGLRPRLYSDRARLEERLRDPVAKAALIGIVAAGGDGTVVDVVNRHPGVPVCPFPLGTENLLCRYLQIPLDGRFVADLMAAGNTRPFDLGLCGDRRFLLMASAGFDAAVIQRLHDTRRGNISHLSYVRPILSTIAGYPFAPMRVRVDASTDVITGSIVVVANTPSYALGLPVVPDATPNDGQFDVLVFHRPGTVRLTGLVLDICRRRHVRRSDVTLVRGQRVQIEVDSGQTVPVQIDGDPAGTTPVEISILPAAATIFAPATLNESA